MVRTLAGIILKGGRFKDNAFRSTEVGIKGVAVGFQKASEADGATLKCTPINQILRRQKQDEARELALRRDGWDSRCRQFFAS